MKLNNFRGELTDISSKKEPLSRTTKLMHQLAQQPLTVAHVAVQMNMHWIKLC